MTNRWSRSEKLQILGIIVSAVGVMIAATESLPNWISIFMPPSPIGGATEQNGSPSPRPSVQQLESLAREITVKVLSGKSWRSGLIISKQGSWYTVLTNGQVIGGGDEHKIETHDKNQHKAELLQRFDQDKSDDDLALFQFSSENDYQVVTLNLSGLQDGEQVFAAGFPYLDQFVFRNGDITLVLEKPLQWGNQVALAINVDKGMIGGPLVNSQGELVGVLGKHQPLWDVPYYYKNGAEVKIPREELNEYSWAIPIETFVAQAPPILLNNMNIKN